jgi:Tfp pilus assembly protein PilF
MLIRALFAILLLSVAMPAFADARDEAKKRVEFGIQVAQRNLWSEAIFWWEKAIEIDPTYAPAYNNLAIAYEQRGQEGDFVKAQEAYDRALELEPDNAYIQQNYELFKEINDRTTRSSSR